MKPQLTTPEDTVPEHLQIKQSLYKSYAGMLLGYLLEVVKTEGVAEQYLVDIFNELQFAEIQAITKEGVNTFCKLQLIARRKLADFTATVNECIDKEIPVIKPAMEGNKFIAHMAPEQQHVFCGMHYHGKSAAMLAAELSKPEEAIRRILKESFLVIRNQRNDTATIHR